MTKPTIISSIFGSVIRKQKAQGESKYSKIEVHAAVGKAKLLQNDIDKQ